jgi:hypothetical protein
VIVTALFVTVMLLLDFPSTANQLLLGAATAMFLLLLVRRTDMEPAAIVTVIILATTGEVVLSMGWGLYSYRSTTLVPLYVPFGHAVFYTLAAATSREPWLRRHARSITIGVVTIGSIIAIVQLFALRDQWGMIWWLGAVAFIVRSKNQLLLSACCVYTILLEWLGTALGNWRWAADVPALHFTSANPPSGVGILYVLLDVVTVMVMLRSSPRESMSYTLFTDDGTRTAEV